MSERKLQITPLSTVKMERQQWAVQDQIPLGVLTILAGTAGIAKSTILAWYVARLTHGELDGDLHGQKTAVAIISGEDDTSKVLVPRLAVAGADLALVSSMSTVAVTNADGDDWISSPNLSDDLRDIRAALIESGARLLIIDPIISLMAGDSHRLEDVRRNLDPLATVAAELNIAIICVAHFNKGGGNASDKVSGSHAFRDIARSLLLLAVDEETDERILTVEKSNYSAVKPSVAFQVESVSVDLGNGEFATVGRANSVGPSDLTVQDLLRREQTVLGERSSELINYVNDHPEGLRAEDVATALSIDAAQARTYLSRAAASGRVLRIGRGVYGPVRNTKATPPDPVATVASVANLPFATHITHTTPTGAVANVLLSDDVDYCRGCGGPLPCHRKRAECSGLREGASA